MPGEGWRSPGRGSDSLDRRRDGDDGKPWETPEGREKMGRIFALVHSDWVAYGLAQERFIDDMATAFKLDRSSDAWPGLRTQLRDLFENLHRKHRERTGFLQSRGPDDDRKWRWDDAAARTVTVDDGGPATKTIAKSEVPHWVRRMEELRRKFWWEDKYGYGGKRLNQILGVGLHLAHRHREEVDRSLWADQFLKGLRDLDPEGGVARVMKWFDSVIDEQYSRLEREPGSPSPAASHGTKS